MGQHLGAEGTAEAKAQDQREPDRFEGSVKASGTGIEKGRGERWEVGQGGRDRSSRTLWAVATALAFTLRWEPPRSLSRGT